MVVTVSVSVCVCARRLSGRLCLSQCLSIGLCLVSGYARCHPTNACHFVRNALEMCRMHVIHLHSEGLPLAGLSGICAPARPIRTKRFANLVHKPDIVYRSRQPVLLQTWGCILEVHCTSLGIRTAPIIQDLEQEIEHLSLHRQIAAARFCILRARYRTPSVDSPCSCLLRAASG